MKAEKSVVQEAEALLEKITPGEWLYSSEAGICVVLTTEGYVSHCVFKERDAEFIAVAPRLVRSLLAEQHRLEAENRSLREALSAADVSIGELLQAVSARQSERDQSRDVVALLETQMTAKDEELRSLREQAQLYIDQREMTLTELRSLREASASHSALAIAEQLEQDSVLLDDDKCQHAIYDLTVCDKCLSAIAERLRKAAALLREQKEQP